MVDAARIRTALACVATAAVLAGCMTAQVRPKLSQAVLDARAHRNAPPTPVCPETALNAVSPRMVGFPFNDSELSPAMAQPLDEPARWLACHAATPVVIRPDADGHGSEAEQDALARRRAEAVRQYFVSRGVAADRVRILRRGEAEPAGDVFLVRAEGRRW